MKLREGSSFRSKMIGGCPRNLSLGIQWWENKGGGISGKGTHGMLNWERSIQGAISKQSDLNKDEYWRMNGQKDGRNRWGKARTGRIREAKQLSLQAEWPLLKMLLFSVKTTLVCIPNIISITLCHRINSSMYTIKALYLNQEIRVKIFAQPEKPGQIKLKSPNLSLPQCFHMWNGHNASTRP